MTEKTSATEQLAQLMKVKGPRARYAAAINEACPRLAAKTVLALVDVVEAQVNEALENVGDRIVLDHAHVPTDWVEYPNGRVGLDSVGNISEIVLDDPFEVE